MQTEDELVEYNRVCYFRAPLASNAVVFVESSGYEPLNGLNKRQLHVSCTVHMQM